MALMDEHQVQWAAAALRATDFGRDLSEEVVRRQTMHEDHTPGSLRGSVDRIVGAAIDLVADEPDLETDSECERVRELLRAIMTTAWRTALNLGVASRSEPGPSPPPTKQPVDHPALDKVFGAFELLDWIASRESTSVEFADGDGRRCEVVVRVLDDPTEEDEGEVSADAAWRHCLMCRRLTAVENLAILAAKDRKPFLCCTTCLPAARTQLNQQPETGGDRGRAAS